jgi:serine/threonine protein kinase
MKFGKIPHKIHKQLNISHLVQQILVLQFFRHLVTYCLAQILSGLFYLHSTGIAHRDIKCANCLLLSCGSVKLADFGASKKYESESIVSGLKGTPHWMAPEVIFFIFSFTLFFTLVLY